MIKAYQTSVEKVDCSTSGAGTRKLAEKESKWLTPYILQRNKYQMFEWLKYKQPNHVSAWGNPGTTCKILE